MKFGYLLAISLFALAAQASTPSLTPPRDQWDDPDSFYDDTLDLTDYVIDPQLKYPVAAGVNRSPAGGSAPVTRNPVYSAMENEE